jgi:hypothetical protein
MTLRIHGVGFELGSACSLLQTTSLPRNLKNLVCLFAKLIYFQKRQCLHEQNGREGNEGYGGAPSVGREADQSQFLALK